ncbi:MAG: porin [Gammaproteobacteria bacterium]|nr:porin [Gammaproteobacteria bacterium]
MKKILAVAVAAAIMAPLAASADTTLYGRVKMATVHTNADSNMNGDWNLADSSRVGWKGSEDLGNGLKAIFQAEFRMEADAVEGTNRSGNGIDNRLLFVGLNGGWGTVAFGRQTLPSEKVNYLDMFQWVGGGDESDLAERVGKALAYVSPDFNGFHVAVATVMDGTGTTIDGDNDLDAYDIRATYENGPVSVSAGYQDAAEWDFDGYGVGGSYNFGMFSLLAAYGKSDTAGSKKELWGIGGSATFGNNVLKAAYEESDKDATGDGKALILSATHNFTQRTLVFAEYEAHKDAFGDGTETDTFVVGLTHNF